MVDPLDVRLQHTRHSACNAHLSREISAGMRILCLITALVVGTNVSTENNQSKFEQFKRNYNIGNNRLTQTTYLRLGPIIFFRSSRFQSNIPWTNTFLLLWQSLPFPRRMLSHRRQICRSDRAALRHHWWPSLTSTKKDPSTILSRMLDHLW